MNRSALVFVILALAGCPARPKDEDGTDDGARESASTGSTSSEPEPKPSV
jgi:hypothetical protein